MKKGHCAALLVVLFATLFMLACGATGESRGGVQHKLSPPDQSSIPPDQVDALQPPLVVGSLDAVTNKPTWHWSSGGGGNGNFRYVLDDANGTPIETTDTSFTVTGAIETKDHVLYVQEQNAEGTWSVVAFAVSKAIAELPETSGDKRTCVVLGNGNVKCWGSNDGGRLGIGVSDGSDNRGDTANEMGAALPVVNLGTKRSVSRLAVGRSHACATLDNGDAKCWGFNYAGVLGTGDQTARGDNPVYMGDGLHPINFGTSEVALDMSPQIDNTCAVMNSGRVMCWGVNDHGQLGIGNTTPQTSPSAVLPGVPVGPDFVATQVRTSGTHACALSTTGALKCWGLNNSGQLGQNNTTKLGVVANQVYYTPNIYLGDNAIAVGFTVGQGNTCALLRLEDNSQAIKCWGEGTRNGLGSVVAQGDSDNEMQNLPSLNLGDNFVPVQIVGGPFHTCALSSQGQVKCWGVNEDGRTGGFPSDEVAHRVVGDSNDEVGNNMPAVDFGSDVSGPLYALSISAGWSHSCALLNNGALKCWGDNSAGQLGLGDKSGTKAIVNDYPNEMGNFLPTVSLY